MQNGKRQSSLKLLLALSLLSAIGILLGKFLAFNMTDFMRFSLENLPIMFASLAFGPLAGLAVGVVQDIVGCLLRGYLLNPIITVGSGAVGLVFGLIYHKMQKVPRLLCITASTLSSHLIGSVIIKTVGLVIYYDLPFGATLLWRLLNYVIVGAIEIFLLYYLSKSKVLLAEIDKIKPKTKKKGDHSK